jgi:Na+/H+ antiporter NhaD/arsenite permease-like protein
LLVAITIAAWCSFATPFGDPSNSMACGPGGHRFTDFLELGVIPRAWPLVAAQSCTRASRRGGSRADASRPGTWTREVSMIAPKLVAASSVGIVLSILLQGESYGYAILQRVQHLSRGKLEWNEGMLYPCCIDSSRTE